MPSKEKPTTVTFWVPKNKRWMLKTIDRIIRAMEEEGIPISRGLVIGIALEEYLSPKAIPEDFDGEEAEHSEDNSRSEGG